MLPIIYTDKRMRFPAVPIRLKIGDLFKDRCFKKIEKFPDFACGIFSLTFKRELDIVRIV